MITNVSKQWVSNVDGEYKPKDQYDDIRQITYTQNGVERMDLLVSTKIDGDTDSFVIEGRQYFKENGHYKELKEKFRRIASKTDPIRISDGERVSLNEGALLNENGSVIGFKDGYCSVQQYYVLAQKVTWEAIYDGAWDRQKGYTE